MQRHGQKLPQIEVSSSILVGGIPTPLKKYEFVSWDDEKTLKMWVKQCHFYHPWLGMVNIAPIYLWWWLGDGLWNCFNHIIYNLIIFASLLQYHPMNIPWLQPYPFLPEVNQLAKLRNIRRANLQNAISIFHIPLQDGAPSRVCVQVPMKSGWFLLFMVQICRYQTIEFMGFINQQT